MITVNDGGGLYTTTGLIDTVIVELNDIEVKGMNNISHIVSCVQKLGSIREAVQKMQKELDELRELQNGREEAVADDSEDESGS